MRALVGVIAIGVVAHAGLPYLPLTGPPPVRLFVVPPPSSTASFQLENTGAADSNSIPMPGKTIAGTNAAAGLTATNPVLFGPLIGPGADNPANEVFGAPIFQLPTPDLLSVTPQMLAAYFGPVTRGTNTATFVGPFPVSFMPPLAEPDKSSHAEYQVK